MRRESRPSEQQHNLAPKAKRALKIRSLSAFSYGALHANIASTLLVSFAFVFLTGTPIANAQQIRTQPIEIIEQSPVSEFSDRAGVWPQTETPQDLLNAENQPVTEQLNTLPGVQAREGGSPTISIRGSAQADRVLRLLEGIPLNGSDGFGAPDLFFPEEIIGSIRVLKGPASVFYGPSAMAGAIDHRLRVFERPAFRASLSEDTGLLGTASALAVVPFKDQQSEARGQVALFREQVPGRYAYQSVSNLNSGRREHNQSDLTRITANGEFKVGRTWVRPLALYCVTTGETPGSIDQPFVYGFEKHGSLFSLESVTPLGPRSQLGTRISDSRLRSSFTSSSSTDSSTSSRQAAAIDLTVPIIGASNVRSFADLSRGDYSASFYADERFMEDRAELGQIYDIPLTSDLTLQPAFRYVSEHGEWLKALALRHDRLAGDSRGHGWVTISEGLRVPSLSDRFANVAFFKGNPSLKPERSLGLEVGAKLDPETRPGGYHEGFSAEASLFHVGYTDFVDTATVSPGVTTKVNSGRGRSIGGEASLGYSVSIWSLALSYGYLDARNTDRDEPLRLSPRHQLAASVAQQLGPLVMELKNTYWSEFEDRDSTTNALRALPPWSTLDFNVRTIGLTSWEVRTGVLNLLDRPRELTLGYPEPQRRAYLSVLRYL